MTVVMVTSYWKELLLDAGFEEVIYETPEKGMEEWEVYYFVATKEIHQFMVTVQKLVEKNRVINKEGN